METPLVSICSITYNHAPFIRQCLDGFLMQQTNFPIEIIINDDCSTDGTTEIIREYAEKYPDKIFPVYQKENQYSQGGRGMFQKFVFPKARGKYIALCEGDDYWTDPLKLQKQVDFLEAHPDYSMCFHKATIQVEDNVFSSDLYSPLSQREYFVEDIISTKYRIPTASILARAEVCKTIPHHPNFSVGDVLIHANAFVHGRVFCLDSCMSVYRRHSGSWTATMRKSGWKGYAKFELPFNFAMLETFPKRVTYPLLAKSRHSYEIWLVDSILKNDYSPLKFSLRIAKYLGLKYLFTITKITLANIIINLRK